MKKEKIMNIMKGFRIIFLLAVLGMVIFIHELGHFAACKIFSIRTPTFSIGFGPPLLQKKFGGTTFQVALIPLGGYVAMDVRDLDKAPYWQKMIITLAGVFNNFLLAFILFFLLFYFNRARSIPVVANIVRGSPAQKAGLKLGDRFVRINNQLIENDASSLLHYIQAHPKKQMSVIVDRNGTVQEITVQLSTRIMGGGAIGYLGAILAKDYANKLSFIEVLRRSKNALLYMIRKSFYFITTFFRPKTRKAFVGPIGLVELTSQSLQQGMNFFLFFVAAISTELGVFNVLPIPLLDGGQAVYYTIEAIAGEKQVNNNLIYLLLLLALAFYLNRRAARQHSK